MGSIDFPNDGINKVIAMSKSKIEHSRSQIAEHQYRYQNPEPRIR